jgi:hypothetical protein
MQKGKYLEDYIKFKRYVYNVMKKYENIKLYDFQYEKEITHNLANYKDTTHYHQKINFWMLNSMKNNAYLVSKDNIDRMISEFKKQIRTY